MTTWLTKPRSQVRSEPTPSDVPRSRRDPPDRPMPGGQPNVRPRRAPGISDRRSTKQPIRQLTGPGVESVRLAPASSTAQSHPAAAGCRAIPTRVVGHRGRPAATRIVARIVQPVAAASTPTSRSSHPNPMSPWRHRSRVAGPCRTEHPAPPRHTTRSRRCAIAARPGLTSRAGSPHRVPVGCATPEPTPGSTTFSRRLDAAPNAAQSPGSSGRSAARIVAARRISRGKANTSVSLAVVTACTTS